MYDNTNFGPITHELEAMSSLSVSGWIDQQQSHGRYAFAKEEVVEAMGENQKAIEKALRRLKEKGRLVRPRQEFYVIVPLEYRTVGAPPPSWYIHDLMRFVDQPYYVGLLTAAGLHGAAHQRPQEFQVLSKRSIRERHVGRARIRFFRKKNVEEAAVARRQTETGHMLVSSPEQTAIDLLRYVHRCGHLSNVATVLTELGGALEPDEVIAVAKHEELANVQRLGYLLAFVGHGQVADALHVWLQNRSLSRVPLEKGGDRAGAQLDERWSVYVNVEIAPDL